MQSQVLVSVIVPTYRREEKYLRRALLSLVNQTHQSIEVVVVDDNPDKDMQARMLNVVHEFGDPRIRYIKNESVHNAAGARNTGILACKGTYITFLDDDDAYLTEKVESQLKFMQENKLDMCLTDLGLYSEQDKLVDFRQHDYLQAFDRDALLKAHIMYHLTGTPTFMFKADKLKAIGNFDIHPLSEEYYLMEKAITSDLKIGYQPGSLVKAYRHNDGGESFSSHKIAGEKALYQSKHAYFKLLNRSEIRFVRFRHYAVMAISYYRLKKPFLAVINLVTAFLSAPLAALKQAFRFIKLKRDHHA